MFAWHQRLLAQILLVSGHLGPSTVYAHATEEWMFFGRSDLEVLKPKKPTSFTHAAVRRRPSTWWPTCHPILYAEVDTGLRNISRCPFTQLLASSARRLMSSEVNQVWPLRCCFSLCILTGFCIVLYYCPSCTVIREPDIRGASRTNLKGAISNKQQYTKHTKIEFESRLFFGYPFT